MAPIRIVVALLMIFIMLAWSRPTQADELAPDLEGADLRVVAQSELRALVDRMAPDDQRRLVGLYAAFDASPSDPFAQVACDDDGDYVVLISDAMLRLAATIAQAGGDGAEKRHRRLEAFASFVARSQVPGRRLVVPPPGYYDVANGSGSGYEERLGEILSFIVARELAHLRAGDLVCPRPTSTKESGDPMWTSAEQREAAQVARRVYPGLQVERDQEAVARLLEAGRGGVGALSLLRFFAQLELEAETSGRRFLPSYAKHHPNGSVREAMVQEAMAGGKGRRGRTGHE